MKRLFVAVLLLISLNGFCQIKYGVKVGANFANISQYFTNSDNEFATRIRLAYNIGAIVEYDLSEAISLQSGVQLTNKGYSTGDDSSHDPLSFHDPLSSYHPLIDMYFRNSLTYLEIPVNVAYKIGKFQIMGGPYIAFGITGKSKDYLTIVGTGKTITEERDIKFKHKLTDKELHDGYEYMNGLDYGLSFGLGYSIGSLMINAGYELGLANLVPEVDVAGFDFDPKDLKTTNSVMNLSVSYFFGKK